VETAADGSFSLDVAASEVVIVCFTPDDPRGSSATAVLDVEPGQSVETELVSGTPIID
jgi:hypothetical protein